jgi:ABC-type nitrate/sulfonate/bicarbonate transport system permease component
VLVTWAVVAHANKALEVINPVLLPTPGQVAAVLADTVRDGSLVRHVATSLGRVAVGFGVAAASALALGILAAMCAPLRLVMEPIIEFVRPIPPLAFLPLLVLYLGIGEASKIGFIAYSAFFPVFTTTREGIKYVDPLLVRAAESLGASERDILRYVIIPAAMPSIMTGLRLSFALSFFVIVAAEFIAAERGLGFLINDAREFFRVDRMLLGAAAIGLLGYVFNQLFGRLERALVPWKG